MPIDQALPKSSEKKTHHGDDSSHKIASDLFLERVGIGGEALDSHGLIVGLFFGAKAEFEQTDPEFLEIASKTWIFAVGSEVVTSFGNQVIWTQMDHWLLRFAKAIRETNTPRSCHSLLHPGSSEACPQAKYLFTTGIVICVLQGDLESSNVPCFVNDFLRQQGGIISNRILGMASTISCHINQHSYPSNHLTMLLSSRIISQGWSCAPRDRAAILQLDLLQVIRVSSKWTSKKPWSED